MRTQQPRGSSSAQRQHYEIPLFHLLAFALSWLVRGSAVTRQRGLLTRTLPEMLTYVGVTLAVFPVAGLVEGRPSIRDLLSRMVRRRVGLQWYAIAV